MHHNFINILSVIIVTIPQTKYKVVNKLKTVEEIIEYMEEEMNEAIKLHDESKDPAQRLSLMLKAYTISELLDVIKK